MVIFKKRKNGVNKWVPRISILRVKALKTFLKPSRPIFVIEVNSGISLEF